MHSKQKIADSGGLVLEGIQEPFILSLACKSVVHSTMSGADPGFFLGGSGTSKE